MRPTRAARVRLTNNFSEGGTGLFNSDQWTIRGDYTINEKMHAFGRFSRFTDILSGKVMFGDAGGPGFGIGGYGGNSKGANESLASGMDIAVNAHLLTDWRFGYYKYNVSRFEVQHRGTRQRVGHSRDQHGKPVYGRRARLRRSSFPFSGTQSTFGAGLNINRCNCPLTQDENQYQVVNNWTLIKGNHSIKIGADLRWAHNLRVPSDTDRAGLFNFGNGPTSANGTNGLGWATFVRWENRPDSAVTFRRQPMPRSTSRGTSSTDRTPGA